MINKFSVVQYNLYTKNRDAILKARRDQFIPAFLAKLIVKLHSELFRIKPSRPCCPSGWNEYLDILETAYLGYTKKHDKKIEAEKVDKPPPPRILDSDEMFLKKDIADKVSIEELSKRLIIENTEVKDPPKLTKEQEKILKKSKVVQNSNK